MNIPSSLSNRCFCFVFLNSISFSSISFVLLLLPSSGGSWGLGVLRGPQFWCWKDSCHKNEWTCSPTQGLMRKADSSPCETYFCFWTAVDVVHWLPNIQFFTLFSIFTHCRLVALLFRGCWAALMCECKWGEASIKLKETYLIHTHMTCCSLYPLNSFKLNK